MQPLPATGPCIVERSLASLRLVLWNSTASTAVTTVINDTSPCAPSQSKGLFTIIVRLKRGDIFLQRIWPNLIVGLYTENVPAIKSIVLNQWRHLYDRVWFTRFPGCQREHGHICTGTPQTMVSTTIYKSMFIAAVKSGKPFQWASIWGSIYFHQFNVSKMPTVIEFIVKSPL